LNTAAGWLIWLSVGNVIEVLFVWV